MKLNLPNKLTLLRIILVPVCMLVILMPFPDVWSRILAAAIFILTSITDMLDGKIARRRNLITNFGKFLDPIADKIMVIGVFMTLMVKYDRFRILLLWATALIVLRELSVSAIRLLAQNSEGVVIAASTLGKIKTVSQIVCILVLLLEPVVFPQTIFVFKYTFLSYASIVFMAVMTVWSGIDYLLTYRKFLDPGL